MSKTTKIAMVFAVIVIGGSLVFTMLGGVSLPKKPQEEKIESDTDTKQPIKKIQEKEKPKPTPKEEVKEKEEAEENPFIDPVKDAQISKRSPKKESKSEEDAQRYPLEESEQVPDPVDLAALYKKESQGKDGEVTEVIDTSFYGSRKNILVANYKLINKTDETVSKNITIVCVGMSGNEKNQNLKSFTMSKDVLDVSASPGSTENIPNIIMGKIRFKPEALSCKSMPYTEKKAESDDDEVEADSDIDTKPGSNQKDSLKATNEPKSGDLDVNIDDLLN